MCVSLCQAECNVDTGNHMWTHMLRDTSKVLHMPRTACVVALGMHEGKDSMHVKPAPANGAVWMSWS